jgi:hypothetical protein
MRTYNPIYRKYINEKKYVFPERMVRAKFYLIKEYEYVDGTTGTYNELNAPIIYTLFVSKLKNVVHAVKVTNVNPNIIKRFFGRFVNEDEARIEMRGGAKKFYESVVSKIPIITNDSYRTYKLDGFNKVIELNMDINQLTPKYMDVDSIDKQSQKLN